MTAPKTRRLGDQHYEILGSADNYGKPYTVECAWPLGIWEVRDSRRRLVSEHFTKRDAVASVEVQS